MISGIREDFRCRFSSASANLHRTRTGRVVLDLTVDSDRPPSHGKTRRVRSVMPSTASATLKAGVAPASSRRAGKRITWGTGAVSAGPTPQDTESLQKQGPLRAALAHLFCCRPRSTWIPFAKPRIGASAKAPRSPNSRRIREPVLCRRAPHSSRDPPVACATESRVLWERLE
jgi:hypothetical protein